MKRKYVDPTEEERAAILARCFAARPAVVLVALAEIERARMAPAMPPHPGARYGAGIRRPRKNLHKVSVTAAMAKWR